MSVVLNALIVLGHKGWLNADIWERDVLSCNTMGAVLYIQKDKEELTPFETRYRARDTTCTMVSAWGSPSLVHITNQLLAEALEKYPNCKNFWIISGTSIPVATGEEYPQDSKTSFERGPTDSFYIHNGKIYLNKVHEASSSFTMSNAERAEILVRLPTFSRSRLIYHSQWCRLSREDAQIVSVFPDYHLFDVIDDFLSNEGIHKYLVGRVIPDGCPNAIMAPDEYYYGLVIAMHRRNRPIPGPICSMPFFENPTDPSPLTFKSFDEIVSQACKQHNELVPLQFTLRQAMKACRALRERNPSIGKNLMTLRKCGELPWNGQGLLAVVESCQAVVVETGGFEPLSAACARAKSSRGDINVGQQYYMTPSKRQAVHCVQTLHPNLIPEQVLANQSPTDKREQKEKKKKKRQQERKTVQTNSAK